MSNNDDVATDAPATISNLTFREGRAVGLISASGGSAGACVFSRESLTVSSVAFINCEAAGVGNGVNNFSTTGGAFAGGNAAYGRAPEFHLHGRYSSPVTAPCMARLRRPPPRQRSAAFVHNSNLFVGNVTLTNVQFVGNSAENVGALRVSGGNNASLQNVSFVSNSATTGSDGAFTINAMAGSVTLSGGGAIGNTALLRRGGGQISTVGATFAVRSSGADHRLVVCWQCRADLRISVASASHRHLRRQRQLPLWTTAGRDAHQRLLRAKYRVAVARWFAHRLLGKRHDDWRRIHFQRSRRQQHGEQWWAKRRVDSRCSQHHHDQHPHHRQPHLRAPPHQGA